MTQAIVPFLDLKAQYESIRSEIESAVLETLASTQFVLGKEVGNINTSVKISLTNQSYPQNFAALVVVLRVLYVLICFTGAEI